MNVLSLFDGISCGQVALQRAGIPVSQYFASEIDKYAIQVTQKNFPNTIQLGDVCSVKGADLPKIDLLIGGSPCQGFSLSGKHLNFDDPRSKLFFEYVRILKECKPSYFILENVKMKQEYQDIISEYLGVEPIFINSSLVSAQSRQRLYWTNIPNVEQPEDRGIKFNDVLNEGAFSNLEKSYCILYSYYKVGSGFAPAAIRNHFSKSRHPIVMESAEGGSTIDDIFPVPEDGSKDIIANYRNKGIRTRVLSPVEVERLQTLPYNYTEGLSKSQRYKAVGNGWTVDVIVHILGYMKEAMNNGTV